MMNKHFLLRQLCYFVTLFLLVACTTTQLPPVMNSYQQSDNDVDTSGWTTYIDQDRRYAIDYPTNWLVAPSQEISDVTHFVAVVTDDNRNRLAVTVVVQGATSNLQRVADSARRTIQSQKGVANLRVAQEQGVTVNSLRGIEQLLTYTVAEQAMSNRIIYLQHPNHTYAISLTAPRELMDQYTNFFDEMLRTFTVLL